jgi:hypothetical protein
MAGRRVHGPEKNGCKRMERQSKGSRDLKAYPRGGQGPPRAVAPFKKKTNQAFPLTTRLYLKIQEEIVPGHTRHIPYARGCAFGMV